MTDSNDVIIIDGKKATKRDLQKYVELVELKLKKVTDNNKKLEEELKSTSESYDAVEEEMESAKKALEIICQSPSAEMVVALLIRGEIAAKRYEELMLKREEAKK